MNKTLYLILLFSFSFMSVSCNSNSSKSHISTIHTKTVKADDFFDKLKTINTFTENPDFTGVFSDEKSLFLASKSHSLLPCEKFTYLYYPYGEVAPWDADDKNCIKKECYIAIVNGNVKIFDETGRSMLKDGIKEYLLYPYGSFVYGKSEEGWNVYTLNKIQSETNNKDCYYNIFFKDCVITQEGALLKGYDDDVFLSHTDEGLLILINLSEEERNRNLAKESQALAKNLLIMNMIFNSALSQNQISQVNNLYSDYQTSTRSRADIERDIAKYQREINFCESHMNDGIAEGMGYSGVISNYSNMIQQCRRELQFAQ